MGWRERSKESVKQLCLTSSNEIIEHLITIDIVKEEMSRVWKRGELMEIVANQCLHVSAFIEIITNH